MKDCSCAAIIQMDPTGRLNGQISVSNRMQASREKAFDVLCLDASASGVSIVWSISFKIPRLVREALL